jgi:large subunit ribosomal protein L21
MYAIVKIAGQQFKVEKDQELFVHRLEAEQGDKVQIEDVLLLDNNGEVKIGSPRVEGAKVNLEVIDHLKGDKVLVFKKKRRKGYQKLNGHRQQFTKVRVADISQS